MSKEKVSIEVLIETTKSAKNVKDLTASIAQLNAELNNVESTDDTFIQLSEALDEANESMTGFALTSDNAELTLSELTLKQEHLNEVLSKVYIGTENYDELRNALVSVKSELSGAEIGVLALNKESGEGGVAKLNGAVGALTSSFIKLGGESGGTVEEVGKSVESVLEITGSVSEASEAVKIGKNLFFEYGKSILQSTLGTTKFGKSILQSTSGTKGMAAAQAALNLIMKANPVFLIIAALTALVALLLVFAANSNTAKKQTEALNRSLEIQATRYENLVEVLDEVQKSRTKELGNNLKLLESEKKLILSKGKLTEEDKKRLSQIKESISAIKLEKIDSAISNTENKFDGLADQINTSFQAIERSIESTDFEDGVNDIDYSKLLQSNSELYSSFIKINREGFTKENVDEQIVNLQSLRTEQQELTASFIYQNKNLGEAEQEEFSKTIERGQEQEKLFDKLISISTEYKDSISDKSFSLQLEENSDAIIENEKATEALNKAQEKSAEISATANENDIVNKAAEKQRLLDLAQLKEETYQDSFETLEELTLRQLELDYLSNTARAEALLSGADDEKALAKLLGEIRENYTSEVTKINEEAVDSENAKLKEIENLNKQTLDNIKVLELQKQLVEADSIKDEIEREKEKNRILDALDKTRLGQLKTNLSIDLQNDKLTKDEKIELQKKYNLDVAKINGESIQHNNEVELEKLLEQEDLKKMLKEAAFQVAQQLADAAFQIAAENRQRDLDDELEKLDANFSAEEEQLNRQVDLGIKTQKQADREKEKLSKEFAKKEDKLRKEAFEKEKKASIAQAIINGALAITKALTSMAPPASYILAATTAISTGIQIATISSQKYAKGGILKGASHENGGIKTPFGEMEGEEIIINKKSSKLFRNELSAINEAGGGVKFSSGTGRSELSQKSGDSSGLADMLDKLNSRLNEPIRSYVVSDEITISQNKQRQLEENSSL